MRPGRGELRDGEGQLHDERRALSLARALGGDTAAVELDQVLHERQPEAEAAVGPRGGAVLLPETVEDERENVGADAPARVAHHDLDVGADALEVDLHPPSLR